MTTHRIPAPQVQAFVACRKITNDPQTGEIVIIGPVSIVLVDACTGRERLGRGGIHQGVPALRGRDVCGGDGVAMQRDLRVFGSP